MAEYRYATYDLLTRSLLAEHLPFNLPSYSRALPEAGTASPTLNVKDPAMQAFEPWDRTRPRRTTVVVVRDGTVVGEYLIWQRPPYKPSEGRLNIGASELRSYFDHRLLRPTLGVGHTKTLSYTQVDQLAIFRALVADCQAVTYNGIAVGSLGIEMDATQMSGVLRDRKDTKTEAGAYHGYDFATYGELLDKLANVDGGFEWRIDSFLDSNRSLRRALRLGYPYLGHPPNDDAVTLEYPGNVADYEWPEDGNTSPNFVAAIGSGEEKAMLWGEAYVAAELLGGYPLLERTTAYKSVKVKATLAAHATADAKALTGDVIVPTFTVTGRPDVSPGDYVKVRISDPQRFPGSDLRPVVKFMRAVEITTEPGPPEKTTIAAEEPRTPGDSA